MAHYQLASARQCTALDFSLCKTDSAGSSEVYKTAIELHTVYNYFVHSTMLYKMPRKLEPNIKWTHQ